MLPKKYQACDFNAASLKFYDRFRKKGEKGEWVNVGCGLHCDVNYKPEPGGAAKAGESQLPNTPVIIMTLGGTKLLRFKKVPRGMSRDEKKPQTFHFHHQFLQNDFSWILLDPEDEMYVQEADGKWYRFQHSSFFDKTLDGNNDSTMVVTIMLRCLCHTEVVNRETGIVVTPGDQTKGRKERFVEADWKWGSEPFWSWWQARREEWLGKLDKVAKVARGVT